MKRTAAPAALPKPREKPTKKNFRLYQSKIDRARKALQVETETEAVDQALDFVIFRDELVKGVRAMRGVELVDISSGKE